MNTTRRTGVSVMAALLVGLTAAGCTADGGRDANGATASSSPHSATTSASPSAGPTVAPTTTPSPTPSPTPTVTPASIPTECTDVVDATTYAATMGETPLNDEYFAAGRPVGQLTPTPPPAGADAAGIVEAARQLVCRWRDPRADITGLFVEIGGIDAETESAYRAWLLDPANLAPVARDAGASYACSTRYEGTLCQLAYTEDWYGVEMADTVLMRDGVVVSVSQANYPTNDLMGALVTRIWG